MPETGKYGIVYADPPWRYDMKRGKGVAENHYNMFAIYKSIACAVVPRFGVTSLRCPSKIQNSRQN